MKLRRRGLEQVGSAILKRNLRALNPNQVRAIAPAKWGLYLSGAL